VREVTLPDAAKLKKQAVIVVHGMGEQRPMETLRSFVTAVWETDDDGSIRKELPLERRTWIVPDRRTGILDLSRVTTRANSAGVRTDFFELYWADVFTGNTLSQLSGWLRGLLFRWPLQVPRNVFWAWAALWLLSAVATAAFLYAMANNPLNIFKDAQWSWNSEPALWHWAVSGAASFAVVLFMRGRLDHVISRYEDDGAKNPDFKRLSQSLLFAAPAAIFFSLLFLAPWDVLGKPQFLLLALSAMIALAIKSFVVPYFGDVARYTLNEPWAIEARAKIRARGLGLLRELHGLDASGRPAASPGEYGRIVVVGHSLGSVIAYDLLRFFWAEAGPVGKNIASAEAIAALTKADAYIRECSGLTSPDAPFAPFDFGVFQALQSEAIQALRGSEDIWKITDFVTLGSPLSHAEFLIADDRLRFSAMVRELVLPACPPILDSHRISFLYDPAYGSNGGDPADKRADHGSLFAATRWTNVHDTARWIVFGDLISGPLAQHFGRGIKDVAIRISQKGKYFGWLAGSLFTHTEYWNAKASGALASEADGHPHPFMPNELRRDHITELKLALMLGAPGALPEKAAGVKSRSAPAAIHPAPADTSRPKSPRAGTTSPPS
jgi:hypothetical protein